MLENGEVELDNSKYLELDVTSLDVFFAMELRILVRWRSKVAENEAMVSPNFKNIVRKKNLTRKKFLELEKVGDPSILVDFGRNSLCRKQSI